MDSESQTADASENTGGTLQDNAPNEIPDKALDEHADRETSRLEKYLNEKEARDPAYRAEREAARKKSETYDRLEADLKSAAGEAAEWEGSQALRRELEDLYPGKAPLDVVDTWLKLNQSYIADPAGTAEWHMQQLLAEAPVIAQARKELPRDGSFDSAWRRADQHLNERNAWTAIMDYARENGISVREGLAQIIHHTKEGRRDPVYATARMAAQAGLPVTPMAQEAAALNEVQTAEQQALADGMQVGLDAIASGGRLPGLERTELQNTIADIIESETFKSTGDPEHDLWNAYHLALRAENDRLRETQAGETKRKANLSISGGTPAGAGARPVPASSREALDRAFADLGG
jgi:hypothetical protein